MILIKLLVLVGGLVGIFHFFDKLSIRQYQRGRAKFGDAYRQERDLMKVGYFAMAAYLMLFTIFVPRAEGSSDYSDDGWECSGSMRC